MTNVVENIIEEAISILEKFKQTNISQIITAAEYIVQAFKKGNKLLIFGNGGSAADAQHLAAEMINRYNKERPSLPAISLTSDSSILTSISNDYNFDEIFTKQINALGQKGDISIGISTSGYSKNIIKALSISRIKGMNTIGLTGHEGGKINNLCDLIICVPSNITSRIQEIHGLIIHILCELIDIKLFGIK